MCCLRKQNKQVLFMEIKNKTSDFQSSQLQYNNQQTRKSNTKNEEATLLQIGNIFAKVSNKPKFSAFNIYLNSSSIEIKNSLQVLLKKIPEMLKQVINSIPNRKTTISHQFNISVVPHNENLANHPTMMAFKNDPGPKILVVAEGHGSGQAVSARKFVQNNNQTIRGFSEGISGQPQLCGIRGLEQPRDCEASTLLKDYNKYGGMEGYSKEETNQYLKQYANFSDNDLKKLDKKFYNKPLGEREKFVTDMQIHKRDINFANHISEECKEMVKNGETHGACFFGASHVLPGNDGEDKRNSDARLPDVLLSVGGELKNNCINLNGVNIYVLPKILEGKEVDNEFPTYFT